jgi:hypothetical protein
MGSTVELVRQVDSQGETGSFIVYAVREGLFGKEQGQIGCLNPELAREIADFLEGGGRVHAHVYAIHGGTANRAAREVELRIYKNRDDGKP